MVTHHLHTAEVAAAKRTLALLDTKAIGLRQELRQLRKKLSHARDLLSENRTIQLQEANQHLLIAALHAEKIAETAAADLDALKVEQQRDIVTGAPNRALMLDRLQTALLSARRHKRCLAVLFLDLDHFKPINDRLGHSLGDEVLQIVARAIQSMLRDSDTLCRYGGDEFLVLLPEISAPADASRIAAEMLVTISAPVSVGGQLLRISASVGISTYPEDGEDAATLIDHADSAMYRHKRAKLDPAALHGDGPFRGLDRRSSRAAGGVPDPLRTYSPDSPLQDLRDTNAQLVLTVLSAQESAELAANAQRRQVKLMAVVAHELRHPLIPLRTAADLLANCSTTVKIPIEELQIIIDGQITHMSRLIDDLLEGARLSNDKFRIDSVEVNLCDVLDRAVASFRPAMESRKQHFSTYVSAGPVRMQGDPVRLAQVFGNLLDNACKYTPEGGEIALDLAVTESDAIVTVRDNGIGISAEALPTIFDMFMHDAPAQLQSNDGLGIGLAVVHELVRAHGGNVVAQSVGRGHGSEFVVTLPRNSSVNHSVEESRSLPD